MCEWKNLPQSLSKDEGEALSFLKKKLKEQSATTKNMLHTPSQNTGVVKFILQVVGVLFYPEEYIVKRGLTKPKKDEPYS